MAVAGITPTASQLTKIGKMQSAGCRLCRIVGKPRQNAENVNAFGAIASVAGDRSGPWTGWIGPAPVKTSGYCLGAVLS